MIYFSLAVLFFVIAVLVYSLQMKRIRKKRAKKLMQQSFPSQWRTFLNEKVIFYKELETEEEKSQFEKKVQRFLATKKITALNTEIDDDIKLMVAASAVIPTLVFPDFNYPNVKEVLIYPNSFDKEFGTDLSEGNKTAQGMVGSGVMNGKVILSKPDLMKAYDGVHHSFNVGIHEFVHLLDATDGDVDGVPENLLDKPHIGPWISEMKKEMHKVADGHSDINPYGLTSNAEFLSVVSEYFFSNPEKFKKRHFELYQYLELIYKDTTHKP